MTKTNINKPNTKFPLEILTDKEERVDPLRIVEEQEKTIFYNKLCRCDLNCCKGRIDYNRLPNIEPMPMLR